MFIEPIRDTWGRTFSHKINLGDTYSLMHYNLPQQQQQEEEEEEEEKSYSSENNNNIKQRSKIKNRNTNGGEKSSETSSITTPLLIIYAFINRHYILDLLPNSSILQNLQRQGFNIFATDWGTQVVMIRN